MLSSQEEDGIVAGNCCHPEIRSEVLEKLDGRKCQDEFATNVDLYNQHKDSWRFQSGSDEQHTEWQDIMETITQQMGKENPPPNTCGPKKLIYLSQTLEENPIKNHLSQWTTEHRKYNQCGH